MSDGHEHNRFRYTIYWRVWWRRPLIVEGTGTSKEGNELLIAQEHGGFIGVNYDSIRYYTVIPI